MTKEDLFRAMNGIDEEILEESEDCPKENTGHGNRGNKVIRFGRFAKTMTACAAVVLLMVGISVVMQHSDGDGRYSGIGIGLPMKNADGGMEDIPENIHEENVMKDDEVIGNAAEEQEMDEWMPNAENNAEAAQVAEPEKSEQVLTTESKEASFLAVILEKNGSSLMVEPLEGQWERNSSDKITFSVQGVCDENQTEELEPGKKVKIFYDGMIMESYPAQIVISGIEVEEE